MLVRPARRNTRLLIDAHKLSGIAGGNAFSLVQAQNVFIRPALALSLKIYVLLELRSLVALSALISHDVQKFVLRSSNTHASSSVVFETVHSIAFALRSQRVRNSIWISAR